VLDQLAQAAMAVFSWQALVMIVIGTIIGIIVGALPGLTATMAMAIFSPLTFFMPPLVGIPFLLGLYKGGTFGGSISAVLIGTPGTASNAATVLDGYPMAQQGRGGKALQASIYASTVGDFFSNLVLVFMAWPLAMIALRFGPPEVFALILFSMTVIASLAGTSLTKCFVSAIVGVLLALVGIDSVSGASRLTFGVGELQGGISYIPFVIGLFGLGEIFVQVAKRSADYKIARVSADPAADRVTFREILTKYPRTVLRSSFVGSVIGVLPGVGAETANWVAYGMAKNASPNRDKFGKGELEGVIAPEVSANANCAASMVPMLAFGIPGDVVTAVMLGAFIAQGLRPGPILFQENIVEIYGIYIALFLSTLAMFAVAKLSLKSWVRVLQVPSGLLYPVVTLLCLAGAYAINNSLFDVGIAIVFGILACVMRMGGFEVAPMVLAFILAPMLEQSLTQSLIMSHGNPGVFFTRPIALLFMLLTALSIGLYARSMLRARRVAAAPSNPAAGATS
jgi:putative tricarboxylic transport membrane protein